MTLSEVCKQYNIESVDKLCELSGTNRQVFSRWCKSNPQLVHDICRGISLRYLPNETVRVLNSICNHSSGVEIPDSDFKLFVDISFMKCDD